MSDFLHAMNTLDINWLNLAIDSVIFLIPVFILRYFKTGLFKPMLFAILRMYVQLFFLGFYLKFVFEYNQLWLSFLWILIMIVVAGFSTAKRSELPWRRFIGVLILSIAISSLYGISLFIFSLNTSSPLDARVFIPIAGIFIGNCLSSSIIGLRTFYKNLIGNMERYKYNLILSGNIKESVFPFMSEAFKAAFGPSVANTATIGIIWLPGIMTGQILAGSDPSLAIKYQILIMLSILSGGILTVFLNIFFSIKFVFDEYSMPNIS
ncbi:MAG: ABC transporter permease [Candidatus Kapabacteria bacterium]|nr:ABC transporter permease [Candidatus Kapabacteria bacterium]